MVKGKNTTIPLKLFQKIEKKGEYFLTLSIRLTLSSYLNQTKALKENKTTDKYHS